MRYQRSNESLNLQPNGVGNATPRSLPDKQQVRKKENKFRTDMSDRKSELASRIGWQWTPSDFPRFDKPRRCRPTTRL